MLQDSERYWLDEEAQETFGLTRTRARVLAVVLSVPNFTLREVGREVRVAPDTVRVALELLVAREILEVRPTDERRGGRQAQQAFVGRRLRFMFDALNGTATSK